MGLCHASPCFHTPGIPRTLKGNLEGSGLFGWVLVVDVAISRQEQTFLKPDQARPDHTRPDQISKESRKVGNWKVRK